MEKQWKIHLRLQDRIGESIGEGDKDGGIIGEGGDKCNCSDSNGDVDNDGVSDDGDDEGCDDDDNSSCEVYMEGNQLERITRTFCNKSTQDIFTDLSLRRFFDGDPTL